MPASEQQAILFLSSHSAYQDSHALACMDALMTTAVFDVPTHLVLHGEGVLQILKQQNGAAIHMKTLSKMFGALSLYGIELIYVIEESLQAKGLLLEDLLSQEELAAEGEALQIKTINSAALAELMAQSKAVFNF